MTADKVKISVYLPKSALKALKRYCVENDKKISHAIEEAVARLIQEIQQP